MQQGFNNQIYNAALYCRLSKDDDNRTKGSVMADSSSIQTQKSMLEDYCRNNGFLIHDFYVDDGYSGLNFNRPSFERMLTDIDNGKINMVVTKDLSRLGRDYIQTGYYTEIYFQNKKVRYIAVNDGFDSNRDDNDIAPFRHILNDMYAKDLSRKVKSAKRQRMTKGYYVSAQAPYGYMVNPENRNQLVVDDEVSPVVQRIFALSLTGQSAKRIAEILTKEKILTPGSYKFKNGDTRFARHVAESETNWCFETIQAILHDRVYAGDMENHKYEVRNYKTKKCTPVPKNEHIVVENTHEPIISREDFNKVQQLIGARHRKPHNNFENIFRGTLYCLDCGCKLNMQSPVKNGKRYHNYRCQQHYLYPEKCPKPHQITFTNLYNAVLERIQKLAELMQDDESVFNLVQQKSSNDNKAGKLITAKSKAEKRIIELSKQVRKLFEDNSKSILDSKNYEMLMSEVQAEQTTLTGELQEISAELATKEDYAGQLEKLKEAVADCLDIRELTPLVLNKLIDRVEVGSQEVVDGQRQQEIRIAWRFAGEV